MGESSCFFRIDSKSFELRIDWTKGRGEVQIVEKGKGFRRWIKASRGVVVWILKSLEACCKWRGKKLFKGDVNDRGRRFRIEMRQNEAGRYLVFSVLSADDRRYFIIIPKGFDLLGWDFLRRHEPSLVRPGLSYVDATKNKAKGRSEEVWVKVGNEAYTSKLKDLNRCLVGRWDIEDEAAPDLRVVEIWANTHWSFCGQGSRFLNGVRLSLDWWAPTVGCSKMEFQRDVSWVANVLKNQKGVEPVSRPPSSRNKGVRFTYCDSEEKARLIDCEGLVSLQEDVGLVKETPDTKKKPNRLKGLKKGLAHASPRLPSSKSREFKTELPKPVFVGESSEQEAPLLDQGHSASSLKSYMLDPVEYSQSKQPEGTYEDPLEAEMPHCMVLKDGRSFTLPGEGGNDKSPWVNKKFLGFCKKPNESKRGTLSGSRKDRELKKLVSTINYDGLAGREAEEGSWEGKLLWLYGPSKGKERRELWEELAAIKGLWSDPWCIAGDFNVVRFPVETSNGRQMSTTMREFQALLMRDWEERVSGAMQFLLPRPVSDHCPILLDCGGMRTGKSSFKFENMWLRVEDFLDKFKEWWQSDNFRGKPSFVLAKKLQALKYDLKMWNKRPLAMWAIFGGGGFQSSLRFGEDKAPRPDGFTLAFRKFCWPIVGGEVNAGRQILDAVLVANEAIDSRKRSTGASLGDPLSPYLFVLIMEAFSSLISRVEEKGFIRGFKMGKWRMWTKPAAVFGCKVGNLSTTYLGLLLEPLIIRVEIGMVKVKLRLEKIQTELLRGDLKKRRKIHLRFPLERESFLRKVIVGKFGEEEGGWTTRKVRESHGMGLWKDIRKGWEEFFLRTSICIGDAADLWGRQGGGGGDWEVHFRRFFQDGNWRRSLKVENSPLLPAKEMQSCKENEESADHILIHCEPREKKECSLENGTYLFVLVHLGRAKSKNVLRGRDVRYELEEPLSTSMMMEIVQSLGVDRFLEWGYANARSTAGGVLVFWYNRVLELLGLEVDEFSVSCKFKNIEDHFVWVFPGV
ncbi:hypothetical protein CK203_101074 [Vitis vinifera]|uniref:DUF4283 domain-containing protein n=1 Tax=Vitis vinifera TaxID=29760 RepID=A0A438CRJ9_VITVI|nr:hypothetical protein CK203_101074 [Vitis vinifera]